MKNKQTEVKTSKKRYRIGVLLDSVGECFVKRIVRDLMGIAKERNINVVFYFGNTADLKTSQDSSQFIFNLPNNKNIDALIIFPNSISPSNPIEKTLELISSLNIPVFSFFTETPGHFSVAVNEEKGINDLVDHLVKYHKYTNFAFLTGHDKAKKTQKESISHRRYKLLTERLKKHDIKIPVRNIFSGSFLPEDGINTANKIISKKDKYPDVLICFNDQMAIAAADTFVQNNVSIPKDIAIVGFDDIEENSVFDFSFTSIDFPIWEMSNHIIDEIIKVLSKKSPYSSETIFFESEFKNRESCGCKDWLEESSSNVVYSTVLENRIPHQMLRQSILLQRKIRENIKLAIEEPQKISFLDFITKEIQDFSKTGQLTDNFIDSLASEWTMALHSHGNFEDQLTINDNFIDTFKILLQEKTTSFKNINTLNNGSLNFYRKSIDLLSVQLSFDESISGLEKILSFLSIPEIFLVLISDQDSSKGDIAICYKEKTLYTGKRKKLKQISISNLMPPDLSLQTKPLAVLPIAFNNLIFGYCTVDISNKNFDQISLLQEMASQIIFKAVERANLHNQLESLNKKNKALSELSLVDEFTGLYNRRGLYVKGLRMFKNAQKYNTSSTFFFFDLDGLKKINDTFGHLEGDLAIKTFADILQDCFREDDLVVRFGGDEFIVLMVNSAESTGNKTLDRITEKIDNFNKTSDLPWELSTSCGIVHNDVTTKNTSFDSLIEESDSRLYKNKRAKKGL